MVNEFGVHVGEGVGEVCAASGPAQRETATASITDRIETVRACMIFSISKPTVYQTAAASVKLPAPAERSVNRVSNTSKLSHQAV